ncbi:MAG: hypothetical protein HY000_16175 [Planctomycetes bacterium]|nr:hypothetical protein [Planctomycetota bacterium]
MSQAQLVLHTGAREVSRAELDQIEPPPATQTWFPIKHSVVLDTVLGTLEGAGFRVGKEQLAIARQGHRFFGTLDLDSQLVEGVSLAVGIRSSTDQSFPLGFACGSRTFVCDNLAFSAEHIVNRKHTRFGQDRFTNAISEQVARLGEFQAVEARRIEALQGRVLLDVEADSKILRAYESGIVSSLTLPDVIEEWRNPGYDEFRRMPPSAWRLLNAFTTVLGSRSLNPAEYAKRTIRLQQLLSNGHGQRVEEPEAVQPDDDFIGA